MLLLAGCAGSEDESGQAADQAEDFCIEAKAFVEDRSVTDVGGFSAGFFEDVDQRLRGLSEAAPADIRPAVDALRSGFAETDRIFARFDYDPADPALLPAMQEVDNDGMLAATDAIRTHLEQRCGLELVDTGEPDPGQVADIREAFGVDQELAECLNRELGDIANVDPGQLTPELLGRAVCGTSLLALLTLTGGSPSG